MSTTIRATGVLQQHTVALQSCYVTDINRIVMGTAQYHSSAHGSHERQVRYSTTAAVGQHYCGPAVLNTTIVDLQY